MKVYLPRVDRAAAVEAEAPRQAVARGSETVLVVEDDEMVRCLVADTLDSAGYRVLDAGGPAEARKIANSYRGKIHLLITDVVLPKGSGRDLAIQLTEKRRDMKVLFMSGYTDTAIVNTGILHKDVAFLQKPFSPAAFTQKVREVLENGVRTRRASE
jgi:DNA-binding NtrC family response regulator